MKMNWKRDRILMIPAALLAFGLTGCLDEAGISTGDIVDLLTADNDGNDPSDVDVDDPSDVDMDGDGIPDNPDGSSDGDTDADSDSDVDVVSCEDLDAEVRMCWENVDAAGEDPTMCMELEELLSECLSGPSGDDPGAPCIALEDEMNRCYEENPEYPEACIGFEEMVNDCWTGISTGTGECEDLDAEVRTCWENVDAAGEDSAMCMELEELLSECLSGPAGDDPMDGCVFLEEDLAICYEENPESPDTCIPFEEMLNECLGVDPATGIATDPCGDIVEEIDLCWDEFAATGLDPERCSALEESLADCAG